MGISVLISVYKKDNSVFLDKALESIWDYQILKPNQIVLIKDGELTSELEVIIKKWAVRLDTSLKITALHQNVGLALALNEGLKSCDFDYIARMDSDDISTPARFKEQQVFLDANPLIDVVGTYISEIDENENLVKDLVKLPLFHDDLLLFFKKRNPLIHPATMFRKSFFDKAGIYSNELMLAEDFHIWYKGFLAGCRYANIPIIGLKFRRTSDFYERRSSFKKIYGLLIFRITKCNRDLNFGIKSDLYAIIYFLIQLSPRFIKRYTYNLLR
jgi:glycosyltransferase involved in cell wall biosynthesis